MRILTRTGGFLEGFSHSLNPYRGCSFGGTMCGSYCYAPAVMFRTEWGGPAEAKQGAADAYRREIERERRRGAVRVFMASVTDPYVPQEKRLRITRGILEAMVEQPPEFLALQTHTPHPLRDLELLGELPCAVQITVETDRASIPGLPPHAYSPAARRDALRRIKDAGVDAVGVVAPLLPLADPKGFAAMLDDSCSRIILDHYLLGDGSKNGARTKRRGLPAILEEQGLAEWTGLAPFEEFAELCRHLLGAERVGISREGFCGTPPR
ncbi:MAG: radical SAM family protein [Planctomycetota bacterium]